LLKLKIDSKEIDSILKNSIEYSYGFLDGIELNRISYMRFLGGFVVEALGKYIDSRARINPSSLHHVYEPGQTGNESARLFKMTANASKSTIRISGVFTASSQPSENGGEPFINRAEIMENGIEIVIAPKNSDVLAFEIDGETVFSTSAIYIANPGGDAVAGSFGRTAESFFNEYMTNAILKPALNKLNNPKEFSQFFSQGTKGGRSVGVTAGRKYFRDLGMTIDG